VLRLPADQNKWQRGLKMLTIRLNAIAVQHIKITPHLLSLSTAAKYLFQNCSSLQYFGTNRKRS